jgi:undecaprenyl-diphosphatase
MEEINQNLFLKINSFSQISSITDFLGILSAEYMPMLFIAVEIYLYFSLKKKDIAIFAFITMILGLGINQIIGLFYFHNRPFIDGLGHTLVSHIPENSFPSDHSTFMFAIAIYLYMKLENKIIGESLLVLSLIGGLARVFIGVHYPFDIIASIISALFAYFIINKFEDKVQVINNQILKFDARILKNHKV